MPLASGSTGQCPHCLTEVRFEETTIRASGSSRSSGTTLISTRSDFKLKLTTIGCPACGRPIIQADHEFEDTSSERVNQLLWPDSMERPVPEAVKTEAPNVAEDFREAVAVLPKSKKASAALARRCLQSVITSKGGATGGNLYQQIESVLDDLPTEIALNLDAVRQVGNFAAHEIKSEHTGEIAEVEEGEAEWLLDVLEELFDHYYVRPSEAAEKRAALNEKLKKLGKNPLQVPGDFEAGEPSEEENDAE